ncbi:MAG: tRNA (adenosine(37)-N6)-threonylcarbamoyltransferase complex transferase subunit TsaD [Planctomycetota bacterium]|nr:tRNA (adenosine(37)-N6)-threonylcarbamoyltransferase complex transferase subunit TsaD [Planctomycetota bacterium]
MIVLGLETSCDETACAVVRDGREVLSNVVASQVDVHAKYGGVVPELASRAHAEKLLPVVREALARAGVRLREVDAIAVGNRPGLIGALLVGVAAAKAFAWALGKPLIGVDHVHAHLYAGVLEQSQTESARHGTRASVLGGDAQGGLFPALGFVVSGGHTAMYLLRSWTSVERLGSTIDDAMGEAFDKAAAILGLSYPGGPNLDRLARTPGANARAVELPISRIAPGSLDFSFSGLKTALLYAARGVPAQRSGSRNRVPQAARQASPVPPVPPVPPVLDDARRADLAASFQYAAVRAAEIKLERAVLRLRASGITPRTLLTGGGVTANSQLRGALVGFAREQGLGLALPPQGLCMDNAAMIAGLGFELYRAGQVADWSLEAIATTGLTRQGLTGGGVGAQGLGDARGPAGAA